uniref:Three prime repair exonuclease 2 n=1 Tax=Cacopsylla melanoneura TaxID=428564 RepID=A0A8D8URM9_9HEMI
MKLLIKSLRCFSTQFLARATNKMSQEFDTISPTIRTLVFFDTETTGLLHREGRNCRIVEMCFVAVLREHLLDQEALFPRVLNKLSLCINPKKKMDSVSSSIHGLTNELLEHMTPLSNDDYVMISAFLNKLPTPICLVAHNGNQFDFPLLRSEMQRLGKQLPDDLLCVDTLPGLRNQLKSFIETREFLCEIERLEQYDNLLNDGNDELLALAAERMETLHNEDLDVSNIRTSGETEEELSGRRHHAERRNKTNGGSLYWRQQANNTTPSKQRGNKIPNFKQDTVYKVLFHETPVSHRAENDVMNLLRIVHCIGEPLLDWMDKHCQEFSNMRLYM